MKKWLLIMVVMSFLADGDVLTQDTLDSERLNIESKTGETKGYLKRDTLQDRTIIYDKYGNQKGWLEKDTLSPDSWRFKENVR